MHRDRFKGHEDRAVAPLRPAVPATMSLRTAIRSGRRGLYRPLAMVVVFLSFAYMGARLGQLGERRACGGSRERLARIIVRQYANEGQARWAMNNPDRQCPTSIDELTVYIDNSEPLDPWGTRLEIMCEPPVGTFGVVSAGADTKFRTNDDIHGWSRGR
jgi:hypothetical protein